MTKEETIGYVYIFTNDSFKVDWIKIGKTINIKERLSRLFNTSLPLEFKVYATLQTRKYEAIEKIIHKQIDRLTDLRVNQNREFFNISPAQALDIFLDQATALDDAVITRYVEGKPYQVFPVNELKKTEKRGSVNRVRPPFDFSMVGLDVGDEIVFDALKLPVKVAGKNKVEHEGRIWSLSAFCGTFLPEEMRNNSGAYQGPKYFSYQGKTLWEIRLEKEK